MNSSSSSPPLLFRQCDGLSALTAFLAAHALFLPLFLFVLLVGYRRWRARRGGAVAMATSHTDAFTYHIVALELAGMAAACGLCAAAFSWPLDAAALASMVFSVTSPGPTLFHVLTCAERHLAVVHPLAYRRLRTRGGVRARNGGAGGVWLLALAWGVSVPRASQSARVAAYLCLLTLSALAALLCYVSVLCALIGPKPGDGGGAGERAELSGRRRQRRALRTMTAITAALLTRFLSSLASCVMMTASPFLFLNCVAASASFGCHLPSSLVLPLLFLQRAGKLPCRRRRRTAPPTLQR